jgi:phosphinothricin acetyltransferase
VGGEFLSDEATAEAPIVRACVADDLAAIQRIYAHYVLRGTATFEEVPPGPDYWRERLQDVTELGLPFLVADLGGEVLGYAYCTRWRPRPGYRFAAEDSVYVAPEVLGRGIGSLLLPGLLAGCEAAGIRQVIAVVASGDDAASLALHRRFGFKVAGRLVAVGFKFGRWLDTTLMQRSLEAGPMA